ARTQRAPLHEVTVDVHTLRVVGGLENWRNSARAEDCERVECLTALPRHDLLRLAALLHDIGKSRGDAGHPERGSVMAHDILTRLQYPPEDIRLVRILIEEHLTLFNLTTLDPTDRGPFDRLVKRLESTAMFDRLYLLTIADAQGVAVGALPLWREDRLRALWLSLREKSASATVNPHSVASKPPAAAEKPATDLREMLLAGLPDPAGRRGAPRAEALRLHRRMEAHLDAMPARYLTRVSAEDALGHVRLIERLGRQPAAVETGLLAPLQSAQMPGAPRTKKRRSAAADAAPARSDSTQPALSQSRADDAVGKLSIVTRDRPGRFSQICAGLTGAGLTVISAEVYERVGGLILDEFRVMPAPAFAAGVPQEQLSTHLLQLLKQAEQLILAILKNPGQAAEVMARMRAHPLHVAPRAVGTPGAARYDAEVQLMDASHEPLTIVDVRCSDRPGLLYALTRAIADLGLNIHFATIDTVRGTATDVFYVAEPDGGNLKDAERRQNLRLLLKAVADHV
ncbi:MAG TPA: ACT domain-containing protein, partial [Planctomycetota bacterium]|nr:ACT domain-containing protein [Planctomycetota bacterium]